MFKRVLYWAWIVLLAATPLILWILPADQFDQEGGAILCPSRLFFDFECYGCGMTRAVMHAHHMEWTEAVYFNYGVVLVYPALVILWLYWFRLALRAVGVIGNPAS
ncbi:MAG: DUF2752 domain-containing protein [Lewinellaceae bacterium]|nr:DUF2752 domain-containing protein [Saprospiraceae bacterium]MCB9311791.1 DUF2752 domain-containing protein [Lewinellaceae bacterium]